MSGYVVDITVRVTLADGAVSDVEGAVIEANHVINHVVSYDVQVIHLDARIADNEVAS